MGRHKHKKKQHDTINHKPKRDLAYYQENFQEVCDFCGMPLEVVMHKAKNQKTGEVVTATCTNENFKGLGCKCELYLIQIRFRNTPWC
jgi:uncharacterized cysteine cluster protein YcgN (CxxCxxCC family)